MCKNLRNYYKQLIMYSYKLIDATSLRFPLKRRQDKKSKLSYFINFITNRCLLIRDINIKYKIKYKYIKYYLNL